MQLLRFAEEVGSEKRRQSIKPSTGCVGKQATIQKISMNPAMAAMEIRMAREEIRHLRRELAWTVLQKAIDSDGAVLPDGAAGDQIRRAVGIMDGPVIKAVQSGAEYNRVGISHAEGKYVESDITNISCRKQYVHVLANRKVCVD